MLIYKLSRFIVEAIFKSVLRLKTLGIDNIPQCKVIVASNHIHAFDPFAVGVAVPLRLKLSYMAKKELFANPIIAAVLKSWNVFPVDRKVAEKAAAALRYAVEFLNEGYSLGIFPEGTRSKDGKLGKANVGAAMIAMRANVPIVPCAVIGTNTMLRTGITIKFAPALYPADYESNREGMQKMTSDMMEQIARMQADK